MYSWRFQGNIVLQVMFNRQETKFSVVPTSDASGTIEDTRTRSGVQCHATVKNIDPPPLNDPLVGRNISIQSPKNFARLNPLGYVFSIDLPATWRGVEWQLSRRTPSKISAV